MSECNKAFFFGGGEASFLAREFLIACRTSVIFYVLQANRDESEPSASCVRGKERFALVLALRARALVSRWAF